MTEKVEASAGAIGYTELNMAEGEFVRPSARSITAAAKTLTSKTTDDFRISLTNAPGKDSYPISNFTWFYVPATAKDSQRGRAVAEYLRWVYTSGEKMAHDQGYSPLPGDLLAKVMTKAATIR